MSFLREEEGIEEKILKTSNKLIDTDSKTIELIKVNTCSKHNS